MPLFNESIESIAQAIVTVNRALKAGVIEKEDYKGLNEYLNQQKTTLKIKKSHLAEAKRNLDDELQAEADEFFMDEDDALYKMAEELLEDFGGNKDEQADVEDDWDKQAKAWAKMNDKERAAMAVLASNWQKSR
jgi:hypothetical protein